MSKSEQIFCFINKVRIERKISQKELAQLIGCSERAIRYWENGKRQISIDMADKALKALKVSMTIGEDEK